MKKLLFLVTIATITSCGGGNDTDPKEIAKKYAKIYCECIKTEEEFSTVLEFHNKCFTENLINFEKECDKENLSEEDYKVADDLYHDLIDLCEAEMEASK